MKTEKREAHVNAPINVSYQWGPVNRDGQWFRAG